MSHGNMSDSGRKDRNTIEVLRGFINESLRLAISGGFISILVFAFLTGCITMPVDNHEKGFILRVGYVSEGDAPVVTLMTIYDDRIRFGWLGGRMSSRRISADDASAIYYHLEHGTLVDMQRLPGLGGHERTLWIEDASGPRVGFLVRDPLLRSSTRGRVRSTLNGRESNRPAWIRMCAGIQETG